jgi:alpha-tubulin suppressor-like RCC1 family protein
MGRDTSRKCGSACGLPDSIDTPERFRSVVAGSAHWCALTRDGRAFCWGWNDDGQIGIGTRTNVVSRPAPVAGDHRFVSLTAGMRHTCGLTVGGEALCWGGNNSLQLGSNIARRGCRANDVCTAIPAPIDEPRRFVVLKAYQDKTCGITATGALYCWGAQYSHLEGDKPLALTHIGATFAFADVSPGGTWFSCAIAVGGRAYCWKEIPAAPVGQDLLNWGCTDSQVCLDETPLGEDLRFRTIASGLMHACGITTDGAAYCWGLKNPQRVGDRGAQCMGPKPDPAHECTAIPLRVGGTPNLLDADTKRAKKGK